MNLAIDSSQSSGSIALQSEGRVIYSANFDIKITHSETLMPAIDYALSFCGASQKDLKAVYLCNGPGSFTGLRIGLATAKGIAFGLQLPLYAYSSLQLCALSATGLAKNILCCIDAKMKEVYFALYSPTLEDIIPPQILNPENLATQDLGEFILCGSAATIMQPLLMAHNKPFYMLNNLLNAPNAAGLFALGLLLPHLYAPQNLAELEPLYLRESTAQVRIKQHL
ncbi:MAG: tRNA (adenosine(37)-N6)-threonylcarbamoyltransferase complex dimerization subunit type 1 TsaB [Candidatus Cloacimonetes bacterium]|nr:tRNA (adenosine(37)-N6)-threonylcarbamoyltransferase complex dimerization subunit type 1 TsaB [Candidatus Cloacimonadota bacterium]